MFSCYIWSMWIQLRSTYGVHRAITVPQCTDHYWLLSQCYSHNYSCPLNQLINEVSPSALGGAGTTGWFPLVAPWSLFGLIFVGNAATSSSTPRTRSNGGATSTGWWKFGNRKNDILLSLAWWRIALLWLANAPPWRQSVERYRVVGCAAQLRRSYRSASLE